MADSQFLFVCCQYGAESALKSEIERAWPNLRFAFSRPGFVTFKNAGAKPVPPAVDLKSVFARTYGFSLGEIKGDDTTEMAQKACEMAAGCTFQQLHVWPRDSAEPGHRGFIPGPTDETATVATVIQTEAIRAGLIHEKVRVNGIARTDNAVLDVIVVDENHWWIGRHSACSRILRQPGGVFKLSLPEQAVSRAYLKMNEALAWSQFPITAGDRIVEIGSAPGGASQALLERGLLVTGIDPSDMHETVNTHANFTHIKKRGVNLKRKEYEPFKWLAIDTNVAPTHTLDTADDIVNQDSTNIRGMLLTLKFPEWKLCEEVGSYIERIRSWGFADVRARQLANNGQEICVAALRSKSDRRMSKSGRKHQSIKNKRRASKKKQPPQPSTNENPNA
ncbi:SAM-dependent methyltransferase [Planctomycetota bacterium]